MRLLALAALLALAPASAAQSGLLEALRGGGHVLFFRHAATDFSQPDADRLNLESCRTQRNLSEGGRSQARDIGAAFRRLRIPVGVVLASPYCRTLETARLAFGNATATRDLVSPVSAPEGEAQLTTALRRLLATPPRAGTNTVLVGHQFSLQNAADVNLAEGEAAVFRPVGASFRLVGRVTADGWAKL